MPNQLSTEDRTALLCCLACSALVTVYLSGQWPTAAQRVESGRIWLKRNQKTADWLLLAQLAEMAQSTALRYRTPVDDLSGRCIALDLMDGMDVRQHSFRVIRIRNYGSRLSSRSGIIG